MVRSLNFGSYSYDFNKLFKTRIFYVFKTFKLAIKINSLGHYAKGTL